MTTLTLNLDPEAKQFIKSQAASSHMSIKDWLLQTIGFSTTPSPSKHYEYTTDDFNKETLEGIREAEENQGKRKRYTVEGLNNLMDKWAKED